jgi:glycosyltransferase involved in cell wall biosynthesis
MGESPRVTVVLPVYNAAHTLRAAAESILHQTEQRLFLRIIDDGSTDNSLDVARHIAVQDSRVKVWERPHRGLVATLQGAMQDVTTPYLARMDADDVAHPQRLAAQLELMERQSLGLCGTRVRMVGEAVRVGRRRYEHWINALTEPDTCFQEAFIECPIAHPTFCMSTRVFEAVGGYRDNGWAEDYDLVLRVLSAGHRIGNVPRALLDWTDHGARLSMNDPRYSPDAFREAKRHYLDELFFREDRPLYQWGAGEVGKPWLREWTHPKPEAVVDIRPGKIGQTIHGVPVITPDDLPPPGACQILIAVGTPGARNLIRDWLNPRGYVETEDYRFLA